MADTINISLPEVTATANSIRDINKNLSTTLEEIKGLMDSLESTWQSEGSDTIRNAFNALQPRIDEYHDVVDSYADFLDKTVEKYTTTETTVTSGASEFL